MSRTKQPKPQILPRSAWRARKGGGTRYWRPLREEYNKGTLHHDAARISPNATLEQALEVIRRHQDTHMIGRGYSDIGYHLFIVPSGEIVAGRPLDTIGAHVGGHNTGNLGICLLGALHLDKATKAQIESLKDLWAWLCWELDLDSNELYGHQDFLPTACPGSAYDRIPEVKAHAKACLKGEAVAPQPSTPVLMVDGKRVGEVMLIDGQSFAPVRVVAEACGKKVGWDPTTKTVSIE